MKLTTAEADLFDRALRRSVTFHFRAGDERRRLENLRANGHQEPPPRTDYDASFGPSDTRSRQ